MATFSITDQTRRAQFTANGSTTEFSFSFQVNNTSEIKVDVDGTLKTESTHYDIKTSSNSVGLNTDGTGKVVFRTSPSNHTPANTSVVSVFSDLPLSRTSVYTSGGNITAASLENDFDTLTMILASHEERLNRAMVAPVRDAVSVDLTLPDKDDRKGRVLGFNATTGVAEQGPQIADVQSLAAITADIQTLAHIEDGTDSTDAIQSVAAIASNISTVLSISSAITTVSGISSQVTSVAADATDIGAVAAKATEIGRIGTADAISDLNTLATTDAVSDMNTLAAISTDVSAVSAKSSLITSTLATNLTTVSPQIATLQSLASVFSGTQSLTVTVASGNLYGGGGTGNVFYINGSSNPALTLVRGITYTFDVSDSSVSGHPLAFKDSGGSSFTTGVTTNGTAGSAGATVVIAVPSTGTMPASYYCTSHGAGMGNTIATQTNDIATVATNIANVNTVASNISTISQKATVDESTALAIALGG